jgi:hypothetical protein
MNSLPLHIPGDYGLLHHEFRHLMVNILSHHDTYIGQFLNEGLAESADAFMSDEEMPYHCYKIQDLYYHYQRKYMREPTWLEIVDNAEVNEEDGVWVDAYALGEMYWRYMHDKYPDNFRIRVKEFMQGGRDWSTFGGKTADQEGAEFIQFMKELAFVGPPLEASTLPFYEDFSEEFSGWTLMRFGCNDHWQLIDNTGYEDSYCAYAVDPYWMDENDVDSWLISPPVDVFDLDTALVQFMYKQQGQGIKPEIYYTGSFSGPTSDTDWILLENILWNQGEGEWGQMKFRIGNLPEKIFLAFRFHSEDGNYASYFIDNFEIKSTQVSAIPTVLSSAANPISTNSATLHGKVISEGETSISSRGFYWSAEDTSPDEMNHIEELRGSTSEYSFVFALRYQAKSSDTYYYLMDNFNIEGTAVGLADLWDESNPLVYPNPLRPESIMSFSPSAGEAISISLYDIHGKLLKILFKGTPAPGDFTLPLGTLELSAGIYICQLLRPGGTSVIKLIVD